jgi:hypothetical protein
MAFTVKGEYERLRKIQEKSKDKKILFECGCACGCVTKIEYQPWDVFNEEAVLIYGYAGFDNPNTERLLMYITNKDVSKRYQDRKYRYWKQWNILERF